MGLFRKNFDFHIFLRFCFDDYSADDLDDHFRAYGTGITMLMLLNMVSDDIL